MCRSPMPLTTVWFVAAIRCTVNVGSSSTSLAIAEPIFTSSPRFFASIATPYIGLGIGTGLKCSVFSDSFLLWWITVSRWNSSTFATAMMSPATAESTSSIVLPNTLFRCASLIGLRESPSCTLSPAFSVPWCTRIIATLPTNWSVVTLNT